MARASLSIAVTRAVREAVPGMTLIELIIVVAVMGILLTAAVPTYRSYMLRVHRTEAIRMLLQASMCQERLIASRGSYDTSLCRPVSDQHHYEISYNSPDTQGRSYVAMAIPSGPQLADPCGSLILDQSGNRQISASNESIVKCWNGR
ncbi:MAG: type IV pilin protein [Lysobacterales bacterium]